MAGPGVTSPDNRLNYARSSRFIFTLGQRTMLQAYSWLYKGVPLDSNSGSLPGVDAYTRQQIKDGVPPSEMDITSLYSLLRRVCDLHKDDKAWSSKPSSEQDTTLEQALHQLKEARNKLSHPKAEGYIKVSDRQLDNFMSEVRSLCVRVLRLAGRKANVRREDVEESVSKMCEDFEQERYSESGVTEAEFLEMSREELQRQAPLAPPPAFYLPPHLTTHNEEPNKLTDIPLTESLCQTCKDGSLPKLIVVEGETGAGKTSLCQYLMSCWVSERGSVQRLGEYQLVLAHHCGRINTRDVHHLLRTKILPHPTSSCTADELKRILERLRVLWLLDGWEEATREGHVLLKDLLQTQPSSHTILVTSRPELSALLKSNTFPDKKFLKVSLAGLDDDERELLLKNKLPKTSGQNTKKSTQEFIVEMRSFDTHLQNYLRNPLKLMLAARLWCEDPSQFRPESSLTQLYMAIKDVNIKRLVETLEEEAAPSEDAPQVIEEWFRCFCQVAFHSVKEASILTLDSRAYKLLKRKGDTRTASQCLSTFLEYYPNPGGGSVRGWYLFSHYSQQCFYAASHLSLTCSQAPDPDSKMNEILKELLGECKIFIDPYLGIYDLFTECFDLSMILVSRVSFGWFCPQMNRIGFGQSLRRIRRKFISSLTGIDPAPGDTVDGSKNMNRYYPVLLHVLEMKAVGCFTDKVSAKTLGNLLFLLVDEEEMLTKCFEAVRSSHYQVDFIEEVARRVNTNLWTLTDGDLKSAWELMSYVFPQEIIVTISSDPKTLSDLEIILFILAKRKVKVHLSLKWHYQCLGAKDVSSDTYLSLLCDNKAKCHLVSFEGHLHHRSSIDSLINSSWLEKLTLRITDVNATHSLCSVTPNLRRLQSLELLYDCPKLITLDSPLHGSLGFQKFLDGTIRVLMLKGSKPLKLSLFLPHVSDASVPAAVNFISSLSRCYLMLYVGNLSHNGGKQLVLGLERNAVHVANLMKPIYIRELRRSIRVRLGSLPLEIPVKEFVGRWHDLTRRPLFLTNN